MIPPNRGEAQGKIDTNPKPSSRQDGQMKKAANFFAAFSLG
jgi:hypothetical protein